MREMMNKIEAFYRENYRKQVTKIGYMLSGDFTSAEDVVQEAYRRAVKYENSYSEDRSSLKTWFNTILINSLRDWQKLDRDKGIVKAPLTDDVQEEVVFIESDEFRGLVKKEVSSLMGDERVRTVLYLWYILGYSAKEISQVVNNMTITNVTTLTNRFKKLMYDKHSVSL